MEENMKDNVAVENVPEANATSLIKIEKPSNDAPSYDAVIEDARKDLYKAYTTSRKTSNIITVIVLLVGLGSMLLITQSENKALPVIGWILIALTVVGLFSYYAINKNKFPNKTRAYLEVITKELNQHSFKDENFTEVTTNRNEKLDVGDIIGDSAYDNVASVSSRNVIHGKYKGIEFMCAETALNRQAANKKEGPLFVGRYFTMNNELEMKGRIIINIKNHQTPIDLPNKTSDLTTLKDSQNLMIYGLKETDVEKVLGKKFYNELIEKLALSEHLINVVICIWSGKSSAYLSYDDVAMTLPFDKPLDKQANEQMVSNLEDIADLFARIGR